MTFALTAQQTAARRLLGGQRHTLLVGGARSGKTFLIVLAILIRALCAPHSRHVILRFRANAARASIALDTLPEVIRRCYPEIAKDIVEHRQDGFFALENGSQIWISGLDERERVEKILGQEYSTLFFNECSQIPYASVLTALTRLAQTVPTIDGQQLRQRAYYDLNPTGMGHWTNRLFREHRDPSSSTLKPLSNPEQYGAMFLNPEGNRENLSPEYLESLQALPVRQRQRFYEGVYAAEIEGALWTLDTIEATRIEPDDLPQLRRVVVAIDPSGVGSREDTTHDEVGIVVAGLGVDGHGYVLADYSCRASPAEWGRVAVGAFRKHNADRIIAEKNFGGAMVQATIRAAGPDVPYRDVVATRGKVVRAEPISALYELKKVHHVGRLLTLEDQMCGFSTAGYIGEGSPDRADALVWALTELMGRQGPLFAVPIVFGNPRLGGF